MSCLTLGLRHSCGDVNEDAQYFVNDLPGVSIKKLADTANSDYNNAKELFTKLHTSSENIVKQDFFAELSKKKKINTLYDNVNIKVSGTAIDGEGYFEFDRELGSFTSIFIKSIQVKFDVDTDILITILDGTDTTTQAHSVVKGFNQLALNYTFKSDTGRVSFTADSWQTGSTNTYNTICSPCNNYNYTSNIGVNVFCRVDKDAIVCQFAEQLEYAMWWKFGILLMWEILNTERVNYLVDGSRSQAKENIANWDSVDPANLGDYRTAIKQCVLSIQDSIKINEEIACSGVRLIKFV